MKFCTVCRNRRNVASVTSHVRDVDTFLRGRVDGLKCGRIGGCCFSALHFVLPSGISTPRMHAVTLDGRIGLHCFSGNSINFDVSRAASVSTTGVLLSVFTVTTRGSCRGVARVPSTSAFSGRLGHRDTFLARRMFGGCRARARVVHCVGELSHGSVSLTRSVVPLNSYAVGLGTTTRVLPLDHPSLLYVRPLMPRSRTRKCHGLVRGLDSRLGVVAKFTNIDLRPGSNTTNRCANLHMVHDCLRDVNRKRHGGVLVPTSTRKAGPTSTVRTNFAAVAYTYSRRNGMRVGSLHTGTRRGGRRLTTLVVACPSARNVFRARVMRVYSVVRTYNTRICVSNTGVGTRMKLAGPNFVNTSIYRLGLRGAFTSPRNNNNPNMNPVYMTRRLVPFLPNRKLFNGPVGRMSTTPFNDTKVLPVACNCVHVVNARNLAVTAGTTVLGTGCLTTYLGSACNVMCHKTGNFMKRRVVLRYHGMRRRAKVDRGSVTGHLVSCKCRTPALSFPIRKALVVRPARDRDL